MLVSIHLQGKPLMLPKPPPGFRYEQICVLVAADTESPGTQQRQFALPPGYDEWVRIDHLAEELDVGRTIISGWIRDRCLETKKAGRATIVSRRSVRKLLESLPDGPDRSVVAALRKPGRPKKMPVD